MNVGWIGAGNMAHALLKGIERTKPDALKQMTVCDLCHEKLMHFQNTFAVCTTQNAEEIIKEYPIVFLALSNEQLHAFLQNHQEVLKTYAPLLVTMAVGICLQDFETYLGPHVKVTRIMPNINAQIASSMTAICHHSNMTEKDKEIIEQCVFAFGEYRVIQEAQFSIFTALCGSSGAFVYYLADAMAYAALKHGVDKKTAADWASETILGCARLMKESPLSPRELMDQVTSPGGTTVEGICTLIEEGFEHSIIKAFDAMLLKEKKIQMNNKSKHP